ncbi:MAG: hypothetical protein WCF85_13890 [Rhodospirillaceae bacterium]
MRRLLRLRFAVVPAVPPVMVMVIMLGCWPGAARAGDLAPVEPTPREQTIQGIDLIMKGLRGMLEQVPLYGPPELTPNGDIILRRLSPPGNPPVPAAPTPPPSSAQPDKHLL